MLVTIADSLVVQKAPMAEQYTMTAPNDSNFDEISRRTALKKGLFTSSLVAVGIPSLSGVTAAGHNEITNGLVAHYPLDDDVSSNCSDCVTDASGNGNDGDNNGAQSGVVGPDLSAFDFDGTDSITAPDDPFDLGQSNFTIAAWVKTTSDDQSIVANQSPNDDQGWNGFNFYINPNGVLAPRVAWATDGNFGGINGNTTVTGGTWTHLIFVFNGADRTNWKIFVDGNEDTFSEIASDLDTSGGINNDENLLIGDRPADSKFEGRIDDVRIYNRVLSDSEIEQLATRLIIVDEDFSQSFVDNNEFREKTIQDGVDTAQPGDTVWVRDADDGAYEEQVVVDKDITLTNAPGHSPTIDGDGNSPAVSIDADGVTFVGFTVTNPNELIGVQVEADHDGVSISNNIVEDIGPTGTTGPTGIKANEPQSNLEIANNVVKNVSNTGIKSTNGIFLDDVSGGGVSNVTIANNEVKDISSEWGTLAILVNATATNVTINGNDVSNISAANAAGLIVFAQGINISSPTSTEVDIVRNKVENVTTDPPDGEFDPEGIKIDGDASGVTCRRNELVVDISVNNADGATLDAKCNWWGDADGPNVSSNNPDDNSDPGDIVGSVKFEPWLTGAPSERGPARCNGRD